MGALLIAGGVLSVASSIYAGQAQSAAYKEEAQKYAREQRVLEIQQAITDANYEDQKRQVAGGYSAAAAHSGVKMSGSVAESLSQSLEALSIEQEYARFDNQQAIIAARENQAAAKRNAKTAKIAGYINGAASLLSTAGTHGAYYGGGSTGGSVGKPTNLLKNVKG
jgi:hypothetical protein